MLQINKKAHPLFELGCSWSFAATDPPAMGLVNKTFEEREGATAYYCASLERHLLDLQNRDFPRKSADLQKVS